MILNVIKLTLTYFLAIVAALAIGAALGNAGFGIIILVAFAGFKSYMDKKAEKQENKKEG